MIVNHFRGVGNLRWFPAEAQPAIGKFDTNGNALGPSAEGRGG